MSEKPEDKRNVIDHFKHMETVLIKGALNEHRRDFSVAMQNFQNDFNFATVMRSSNAFLAKEVIGLGGKNRKYDRRGTVGTHHYENVIFIQDLTEFKQKLLDEQRQLVIMEDTPEALPLPSYQWEERSCILLGSEGVGVSEEILNWVRSGEVPGEIIYVPQYGSVRSLNAAVSAGIAMYDYAAKTIGSIPPWAKKS